MYLQNFLDASLHRALFWVLDSESGMENANTSNLNQQTVDFSEDSSGETYNFPDLLDLPTAVAPNPNEWIHDIDDVEYFLQNI